MHLPVADPWYVCQRVGEGITLVTEPHVHPLLRCNVWHVQGGTCDLVIDTALGLAPLRHLVERDDANGLLAVATHCHSDHVGGHREFEHRAAHPAEAGDLAVPGLTCLDSSPYGESVLGPYRQAGYEIPALLIDAVPPGGLAARIFERGAAPVTHLLEEGDIIDLGDRAFEVLHVPGHSPGSIALWEKATGTLFSGDAIYDGPLLDDIEGSDIAAYVTTMQRLRELPVEIVHAGHEPSFGRERLVEICGEYLASRG